MLYWHVWHDSICFHTRTIPSAVVSWKSCGLAMHVTSCHNISNWSHLRSAQSYSRLYLFRITFLRDWPIFPYFSIKANTDEIFTRVVFSVAVKSKCCHLYSRRPMEYVCTCLYGICIIEAICKMLMLMLWISRSDCPTTPYYLMTIQNWTQSTMSHFTLWKDSSDAGSSAQLWLLCLPILCMIL